jgi:hypothetical protein
MRSSELRILGTEMLEPAVAARAEGTAPELRFLVQVENPGDESLYVWASLRGYDYDSATDVLTVYLTDHKPDPPPGIVIISQHPRTPVQVVVEPGRQAAIQVLVPAVIRRRVPGTGLGMSFVEEPIGPVERIDLHVQYANAPLQSRAGETPDEHRQRLLAHGQVMQATITPTRSKEL